MVLAAGRTRKSQESARPRPARSPDQSPVKPLRAVFQRITQIDLNRPDADTELRRDFVVRLLFHDGGHENLTRTRGQFGQRAIERLDILPSFHDRCRVGRVIRNIEQSIDRVEAEVTLFDTTTVGRNIQRDAEQIVFRTINSGGVRHSLHAQKSFLQGIACKFGRTKPSRQTLEKAAIIGRKNVA